MWWGCNHLCLCVSMLQILYRAKDLDPEPRTHVVRGNHTQSALLAGLRKFVLYELQVLAFTRIGNGVPSSPFILERTKDDGTCGAGANAGLTAPQVCFANPNNLDCSHFKSNLPTTFSFQLKETKQNCFSVTEHLYGKFQPGVDFYSLIMKLCRISIVTLLWAVPVTSRVVLKYGPLLLWCLHKSS